jgi:hypothetical protein
MGPNKKLVRTDFAGINRDVNTHPRFVAIPFEPRSISAAAGARNRVEMRTSS